jgi:hypothetical protein
MDGLFAEPSLTVSMGQFPDAPYFYKGMFQNIGFCVIIDGQQDHYKKSGWFFTGR